MPRLSRAVQLAVLLLGAAAAVRLVRGGALDPLLANVRRYSAPSVGFYDALAARFLSRLYQRVARETSELLPSGRLLDVGSGPGRLEVTLAQTYPELRVVGVDISPEMVERAGEVAREANLGERVMFEVGDVASLPSPDASFDLVFSTLSMHHWKDPERGLAEIHRVLKRGGVARIYDVADWIRHLEDRGAGIADLASRSPFGETRVETVVRVGPLPIVQRAELRKETDST